MDRTVNLWQRFKRLNFWNRLYTIAAICSIVGFLGWLLCPRPQTSVNVDIKGSPEAKVQTAVNSPGAIQIITEQVNITVSPKLERKLTIDPVHLSKPLGDRYESLFEGKLEVPYPIPNLRVEAHGESVQQVSLSPRRGGVHFSGPAGKREGYAFTTLQNAIGNLQLKVMTRKPEKLDIRFTAGE